MLMRDLRYTLRRLHRSRGFTLTALITLALGTAAMELADPQLRQDLSNVQLALAIASVQDPADQPHHTSMDKEPSAPQENFGNTPDRLLTPTDPKPYDVGALSYPGYQRSRNITSQFSTQHELSRRETIDTRSETFSSRSGRVSPLAANTRWAPGIEVPPNGVLPPPAVPQLMANPAIRLRSPPGIENSALSLFIDANVRRSTHVTVNVDPTPMKRIQILNLPISKAVAGLPMKKLEEAVEVE